MGHQPPRSMHGDYIYGPPPLTGTDAPGQFLTMWDGQKMTEPPMRAWIERWESQFNVDFKPKLILTADNWYQAATIESTPVMTEANIRYAVKSFSKQSGIGENVVWQFVDRALKDLPATKGVVKERRDWESKAAERLLARNQAEQAAVAEKTERERAQADLFAMIQPENPDFDAFAAARIAYEDRYGAKWDAPVPSVPVSRVPEASDFAPTAGEQYIEHQRAVNQREPGLWPYRRLVMGVAGLVTLGAATIGDGPPELFLVAAALMGIPNLIAGAQRRGATPKDGP